MTIRTGRVRGMPEASPGHHGPAACLSPARERVVAKFLWHVADAFDVGVELPPYPPRSLAEVHDAIDAARERWQNEE